ncbi:MAG: hypothetical protein K6B45_11425 [Bacteroidaceae bacterium]|nr:hypothetical protein [Bacteroidaceae bacterium]
MRPPKKSFLSNLLGRNTYYEFKGYAIIIVFFGTCILAILFGLSLIFHYKFISNILNLFTGTSILFGVYVGALILLLDFEVDVEEKESPYLGNPKKVKKTTMYNLTIFWGVLLLLLGVAAIHFSNQYSKRYAFECSFFLVDEQAGIYHINYKNGCKVAKEAYDLKKIKGYKIDKSFTLCKWCDQWAEDVESEYGTSKYYRK